MLEQMEKSFLWELSAKVIMVFLKDFGLLYLSSVRILDMKLSKMFNSRNIVRKRLESLCRSWKRSLKKLGLTDIQKLIKS